MKIFGAWVTVRNRSLLVTPLVLLALAAPVHAEPLFLAPFLSFDTGLGPQSVAVADLNADGHPDLVTANTGILGQEIVVVSHAVTVQLGNGDGTFAPGTDFGPQDAASSVAIADLNGDGRLDLAVANFYSGTVSVLLGNGDGTFAPNSDFDTGGGSSSVAIADLNGDGRPDLAVANFYSTSNTLSVLLGNGDGTFGPKTDFGAGRGASWVAIADLNGDGRPDLAVANLYSNTASVLLGNGDGTFGPKTDFAAGSGPSSVAIADLNGDGRPDLAVANVNSRTVSALLGNGDGTFGPRTDFGTGCGPWSVAIADLNADGRPDLATANACSAVSVLLGNGDGTFAPKTDFASEVSSSMAIADLNADGRPDLATANYNPPSGGLNPTPPSHTVSVMLGNGDGTFGVKTEFGTGTGPQGVAVGDLDADGRPDLATANAGASTVSVLLGNGDGTFGANSDFGTGSDPQSLAIADLNGDGRPDLATANYYSNTASVLLGNGDGTFGAKTDFAAGSGPSSVAITDLNADGRPDLAVANRLSNTVSVLLGNGDGTFAPKTDFASELSNSMAIADLNADGRPDLAVANAISQSNMVSVLLGNGDGTFGAKTDFGTGSGASSVAIADLNADGRPDLAVAGATVSVLLGNGDGTFGVATAVGAGAYSVAIADLNADGRPDLATTDAATVSVLLGNGDGTFGPRTGFGTGSGGVSSVAIADLNADGRPDLAAATGANTVSVLFHSGPTGCSLTSMSFDFSPNTLNLRSRAQWVTATLEPEAPATPADIDVSSIRLNHSVQVDPSAPTSIGDVDGDGRADLTVKFDRAAVEVTVEEGEAVTVTVRGGIGSGCFEATDVIRVIRAHVASPSAGSVLPSGTTAEVRWGAPQVEVQSVAVLFSSDDGSTWNLVARELPNTGSYLWTVAGAATDQARVAVVLVESAGSGGDEVVGVLGVSGRFAITSPLAVGGPSVGLSLHGSVPNPGRSLSVSFTLPDAEPARLLVYDISGREVSRREVGHLGMGAHVVTLSSRRELAPGVYLVHLIQGNRRLVARAVVIR